VVILFTALDGLQGTGSADTREPAKLLALSGSRLALPGPLVEGCPELLRLSFKLLDMPQHRIKGDVRLDLVYRFEFDGVLSDLMFELLMDFSGCHLVFDCLPFFSESLADDDLHV
jgi:hypothetical protein